MQVDLDLDSKTIRSNARWSMKFQDKCSIDNVIPDQLVHVDLPVVSFIQPLDLHVLATCTVVRR